MIPISPQPEPPEFDARVRQPGIAWLRKKQLPLTGTVPSGIELYPYWRTSIQNLHRAYQGVCAYICVYIEPVVGSSTVDHFLAKSQAIEHAYEWNNYRLACAKMNSYKGVVDTLLDPMFLASETFYIEFVTGRVYPNPSMSPSVLAQAEHTLNTLRLNDEECCTLRQRHLEDYIQQHIDSTFLRRYNPFVWYEAHRQGLL
jgi:uncharacterized protein (TIGR02646 family)